VKPATEPPGRSVTARRRAVALAGHVGEVAAARAGLEDDAATVRATALGALARLGALEDGDLAQALGDAAPEVRRRACELSPAAPSVGIAAALDDPDHSVTEMAAWAAGERGDLDSVPALAAMAAVEGGHPDPLCREAAVAALGVFGAPAGLAAVIGALDDKPAIRRRAATALAGFDDPAADAALERCLDDRDWQVRQVAEELLDTE
jgi:HEAT repeat protein